MSEETYDDTIVCPNCGYRFDCPYEFEFEHGAPKEIECERCEKPLEVTLSISYDYTTKVK
jgi:uncharacterized paraquat-inducible protein A